MSKPPSRLARLVAAALCAAGVLAAGSAGGQSLPGPVRLPPIGETVDRAAGAADGLTRPLADRADPRALLEARRLRLRALARAHPREVELDLQGRPVMRGEVLALAPSPEALAAAKAAGFSVVRESDLPGLDLRVVVLAAPPGESAPRALQRLRRLQPQATWELNHLYEGSGVTAPAAASAAPAAANAGAGVRLGLIDGGAAADHPALKGAGVDQRGFVRGAPAAGAHGTAVAALAAGRAGTGARLSLADVYGASGPPGGSAEAVVRALAWMGEIRAPVVNVSLVGPDNAVLHAAVKALHARGQIVVAAVGNDGPAAPPLFPAAYPETVAVTAVDGRRRVLPEAGRGPHVDFAARGADLSAAEPGGGEARVRGTSFAAPLVAAELARRHRTADPASARRALAALAAEAEDLGAKGRDPVFGAGLVAF